MRDVAMCAIPAIRAAVLGPEQYTWDAPARSVQFRAFGPEITKIQLQFLMMVYHEGQDIQPARISHCGNDAVKALNAIIRLSNQDVSPKAVLACLWGTIGRRG
mmetsp:Transcript_6030/g.14939  ORF Transcript_6030/g.14939 Transcript_6030/m.14939 type:complete len:103 (+) Transcript_6030:547-855(+)